MTVASIPTIAVFPEDQLTLDQKIEKWTWQLCRSLEKNYENYHRRMITSNSERYEGELSQYAKDQLESMNNGTANLMKFRMEFGRKYIKIIQQDYDTFQDRNEFVLSQLPSRPDAHNKSHVLGLQLYHPHLQSQPCHRKYGRAPSPRPPANGMRPDMFFDASLLIHPPIYGF